MKFVLTPDEMRAADADGVRICHIPSQQLMENAAASFVDILTTHFELHNKRVLVLCGVGNNGGDGFAIARMLREWCDVEVLWIGESSKMTNETRVNYELCQSAHIACLHLLSEDQLMTPVMSEADIVLDALVGIGADEHLRGLIIPLLRQVNAMTSLRVAVDVPSGLNALSGRTHEHCFQAHHTITMAALKVGLVSNEGMSVCGQIHCASIGLPETIISRHAHIRMMDDDDLPFLIPRRKRATSKFDYGRVCIIAGSRDMPGAAALSANAAMRSGAGLVELCSTVFHPAVLPEILQTHLPATENGHIATDAYAKLESSCAKADVIVIGCGLGSEPTVLELMKRVIETFASSKEIVLDADGLRAFNPEKKYSGNLVVSPHAGEFEHLCALFSSSQQGLETEPLVLHSSAQRLARTSECCVVLKTMPVIICDAQTMYWSTRGNAGMATAGSGDVLSGVIGAMLCRVHTVTDAAATAVFVHAKAAELAAETMSLESITASTILEYLPFAFVHDSEYLP